MNEPVAETVDEPGLFDQAFFKHKTAYISQAAFAGLLVGCVVVLNDLRANAAMVTAIASSAFLAFMNPSARLAQPRRLIGGHAVGVGVGLLFYLLAGQASDRVLDVSLTRDVCAALAVGTGILVMSATNSEHPPAAGTILGLVFGSDVIFEAAILLSAAVVLSSVHRLLRHRLIDLI